MPNIACRITSAAADLLRFGENKYGDKYTNAVDATECDYQTLSNAKPVAEKVEIYRRRENLSWSHHAEVAALPLKRAEAPTSSKRKLDPPGLATGFI